MGKNINELKTNPCIILTKVTTLTVEQQNKHNKNSQTTIRKDELCSKANNKC